MLFFLFLVAAIIAALWGYSKITGGCNCKDK